MLHIQHVFQLAARGMFVGTVEGGFLLPCITQERDFDLHTRSVFGTIRLARMDEATRSLGSSDVIWTST